MQRAPLWIIAVSLLAIVAVLGTWTYFLWTGRNSSPNKTVVINSFATCVSAGNSTTGTAPNRQCHDTATDTTYDEQSGQNNNQNLAPSTHTYTSQGGIAIQLDDWIDQKVITSPATITGKVPGNWSFEASFPIELQTSEGHSLVKAPATLTGNWMTTDLVSFTATLSFDPTSAGDTGYLILHKDNPSDLAENDDSVHIEIHYK